MEILYNDKLCTVVNKPSSVLVHPTSGHEDTKSVAGWWLSQPGVTRNEWPVKGREGIVHRLDKDTSGALLLAKTPSALVNLQRQFHDREIKKRYWALVWGRPRLVRGTIRSIISRDQKRRTKRRSQYVSFLDQGKAVEAISQYRVIKTFNLGGHQASLVEFKILTGRTHQIRLHAKMVGCPVIGDPDYHTKETRRLDRQVAAAHQILHARDLTFRSPDTHKKVTTTAPLPNDFTKLTPDLAK